MATNDDQYVPSEDEMRHAYWLTRMLDHHAAVNAAFDRFLARVRRDAAKEAWEKCAAIAACHGAFDGGRTRWLSSINPYGITEKEKA